MRLVEQRRQVAEGHEIYGWNTGNGGYPCLHGRLGLEKGLCRGNMEQKLEGVMAQTCLKLEKHHTCPVHLCPSFLCV